jgi:hypothetical protein
MSIAPPLLAPRETPKLPELELPEVEDGLFKYMSALYSEGGE